MKTFFDCIPCFIRQGLDAVRLVTDDEAVIEQHLRKILQAVQEMDMRQSPPAMGRYIHRLVRELTGQSDPYRDIKIACNNLALELYPQLKRMVQQSDKPLETAVRLSIAGNVIDFGVKGSLNSMAVHDAVKTSIADELSADAMEEFAGAVAEAENILYLADNAGEIIFDRLLIKQISPQKVTLAIKGSPVINDAIMEDARVAGLTELVEVIDNGSDAPGTILDDCSESFQRRFNEADLVIAKGQGNYETLSEVDKNMFFILKAKCPVIARDLDCEVGSLVLQRSAATVAQG